MNYTTNYHLPQWDEGDRIMRTDFNRMCADMEAGLNSIDTRAAENKKGAQTHLSGLDKGLFRLAYNHYCMLKDMDPQPAQIGMFYHNVGEDPLTGSVQVEGARYMALGQGTTNIATFFNSFEIVSSMKNVPGNPSACVPQVLSFRSPLAGWITQLLYVINQSSMRSFRLRLKNLNTGEVEWVKQLDLPANETSGYPTSWIPFHANVPYHLIVEPVKVRDSGTLEFRPLSSGNVAFFYSNYPGCTTSQTLTDFEVSQGGMAIVRCKLGGTGGTVTLTWNGQKMEPAMIRTVTDDGVPIQEWIYVRKDPLPRINEFTVTFQCNMDGDILFYDWGAILL